jgi:aquaporin Z
LATFGLVIIGCGAIALNEATTGYLGAVGIPLVFGLAVAGMIFVFGPVSGAHMNPAVTVSLWISGRFEKKDVAPYVVSQMAGATAGAFLLRLLFGADWSLGVTVPSGAPWVSFALEVLMTWTLVFAVLAQKGGQGTVALLVGGIVTLEAIIGGPISGASMNPARSLGPALAAGQLAHHWIYWVAPLLGGWAAVKTHRALRGKASVSRL